MSNKNMSKATLMAQYLAKVNAPKKEEEVRPQSMQGVWFARFGIKVVEHDIRINSKVCYISREKFMNEILVNAEKVV
jgi:hypothetical protein